MATTGFNNVVRQVNPKSLFESAFPVLSTSAACTWNQGDMIKFDPTNKILSPITGTGDGVNFVGIAQQSITNGKYNQPYIGTQVDASEGISDIEGPVYGNVFSMYLKSGDAFTPGAKVYIAGIDAQTVSVSAVGSQVGIFQGRAVTPAASGTLGDVLIGAQYGLGGIQF